jgi:hypothetical protein
LRVGRAVVVYLWEIISAGIRLTIIFSPAGVLLGSGGVRQERDRRASANILSLSLNRDLK